MSGDMPSIDMSGIEQLRKIKEEQDVIKERLEKMIQMKEKVSDEVYQKVYGEYSEKLDHFTDEAEPLKNKVRGQYAILRELLEQLDEEAKIIALEKEEMEFRNTLGEYEEDQFQKEMHEWEVKSTSKQAELDEAQEMKANFLSVFDSEEDLTIQPELTTIPVQNLPPQDQPDNERTEEIEPDEIEPLPEESEADITLEPESEAPPEPQPEYEEEPQLLPVAEIGSVEQTVEHDLEDESMDDLDDDEDEDDSVELMPELPQNLMGEDDLEDDLTGDLEDSLLDDSLGEDLDDLDDSLIDEMDEDTGELEPPLPPIPTETATDPGGSYDNSTFQGDDIPMPPLPEDKDATLVMEQLPITGTLDEDDPDGTMIIANPRIISMNHATEGQTIVLGMGTTSIGRSPDNDIHITEDRISRKHSQITFGPGGYALYDLNSENGTYVNGQRIREHFLQDGDIVMVGTYKYLYRDH